MQTKFLQFKVQSNLKVLTMSFAKSFVFCVLFIGVLVLAFYNSHSYFTIVGASMEPTVASSGFSCYISPKKQYNCGDIVVAFDSQKHSRPVIKRIIAVGGDKIGFYFNNTHEYDDFEVDFYQVALLKANSTTPVLLKEHYLYANITNKTQQNAKLCNNFYAYQNFISSPTIAPRLENFEYKGAQIRFFTLEQNEFFLLGDNRKVSQDSSTYGPIKNTKILGKVDEIFDSNSPTIIIALKHIFGF